MQGYTVNSLGQDRGILTAAVRDFFDARGCSVDPELVVRAAARVGLVVEVVDESAATDRQA